MVVCTVLNCSSVLRLKFLDVKSLFYGRCRGRIRHTGLAFSLAGFEHHHSRVQLLYLLLDFGYLKAICSRTALLSVPCNLVIITEVTQRLLARGCKSTGLSQSLSQ